MIEHLWAEAEKALEKTGGHDLSHVRRVYKLAMKLAEGYPECDMEILSAAVILHDIARFDEDNDPELKTDHAVLGASRAKDILLSYGWTEERAQQAADCIASHRYRTIQNSPATLEAKILFDADKLDSLGAVGVARLFLLSGQYGEQIYIEPPEDLRRDGKAPKISDFSKYSPNLEYELKMRHIPGRLFTEPAREMAGRLMPRMERFFEELREEINL